MVFGYGLLGFSIDSWVLNLVLELGFEVLKSVSTCWEYRIHPWSMNSCL